MGRSTKEDKNMFGTGLLDKARKALQGRTRSIDDAIEQQTQGQPSKKKKKAPSY